MSWSEKKSPVFTNVFKANLFNLHLRIKKNNKGENKEEEIGKHDVRTIFEFTSFFFSYTQHNTKRRVDTASQK